jgi:pilus retraction protein PilT
MAKVATPPAAPVELATSEKLPIQTQRTKSGTASRVKSASSSPRTKSATNPPRKSPAPSPAAARTTTAPRAGALVSPAGGLIPPAPVPVPAPTASAFDFSLDDGIDLGSPLSPPSSVAAAPADAGISLGALDGGNFELELGDAGEPPSFEVDFSTNRPRSFEPPATEAFEVNFSANPSQRFGGAAATTAEGDTGFVNLRQTDAGVARPRSDEGFARPRASDGFARPLQTDDGFARPRMNDAPAFASAAPLATLGHDRTETMAALGLDDARPQEIGHAGTQPIQANVDALDAASTSLHNPVFTTLVAAARELGASDLHIAAARVTSIRVHGELVPIEPGSNPLSAQGAEEMLLPLLEAAHQSRLEEVGYIDLALDAPGGGRLRANISRQQQGLKGTFRLALAAPATLEELGLPADLAKVVGHHQGLVVIAGPSGHGKTTTLAALVDLLNSSKPYHILTIEDPVEIVHRRKQAVISQREAGRPTTSFARGLKASLREDPDVIVLGELRDRESVEIALTAAETGHLVIATMSTPSAAKTIDRLIDMFPPEEHSQVRASVAGALRAIVAQRLLPRRGGGIVPAIELVTGVLPLAVLIREDKLYQLPNLMQRGRAFGMIRFDESLAEHVRAGRLDEEVALAAAESKKDLAAVLRPVTPAAAQPKTSQIWGFGTKKDKP